MYQQTPLPRRTFLGLELRARPGPPEGVYSGIEVLRVAPGGTAARLGVRAGDRLFSLGDEALVDARDLAARARTLASGSPVVLELDREGERLRLGGEAAPLPLDVVRGAEVCPGEVVVDGARLRTFLTIPSGAEPPFDCVLHLPGLGCGSCELSLDPDDPTRRLFEGLSSSGMATMRVERSGVGDSEGPPCQTLGFFEEVAAYRAALDSLAKDERIARVVLFGQSVGGMIAPLLASEGSRVQGVVVFGTSSLRWYDCIVSATRRQRALAGMAGEELDRVVGAWSEIHRMVCREGKKPHEVFAERPDLAFLEGSACHGASMYGRHVAFYQELERLDLPALHRTSAAPVLVLHGEYDWVCHPDEGRAIASEARAARFILLSAVGHDMRRHESLASSFTEPRRGVWDDRIVLEMASFVAALRSEGVLDRQAPGRAIEG